jgi:hypothetical protein
VLERQQGKLQTLPGVGCLVPVVVGVVGRRVIADLPNPQDGGRTAPAAGQAVAVGDRATEREDPLTALSTARHRGDLESSVLNANQDRELCRRATTHLDQREVISGSSKVRCPSHRGVQDAELEGRTGGLGRGEAAQPSGNASAVG